jgi:uncharacterized membrane protein
LHKHPAQIFLLIALFLGTCFVAIIPPFQSPDEYNHFFRAWHISEGNLLPEKTFDARLGGQLPKSLDSLKNTFLFLKNDYTAKTSQNEIFSAFSIPLNSEQRIFIDFPNTGIYAPTAYIPQAFGIFIGQFCRFSPLLIFYLARWMNLLVWIGIVYFAIRTMPFHAWTLAFCAILPATLVIAASLNADVITNALCFWIIAQFVSNSRNNVLIISALLITSLNKIVFSPFILLQKLFQHKNYSYKHYFLVLSTLTLISVLVWSLVSKNLFISYNDYHPAYKNYQTLNEDVNPEKQLDFILHHPLAFSKIVVQSFANALPSTSAHLVGKFGWEKNYLPSVAILFLWLGLFFLIFTEKNPLENKDRFWLALCILTCLLFFSITMYALWCPVGSPVLLNLQGRYFLPLLPLLLILMSKCYFEKIEWLKYLNIVIWIISNLLMINSIINRYYN